MSGRPRRPIAHDSSPAVRELAVHLRELHHASGLTTSELARLVATSPSTLSRAFSGVIVPNWVTVNALADAAQSHAPDRAELRRLWERARAERAARRTPAPKDAAAPSVGPSAHTLRDHHRDFDLAFTPGHLDTDAVRVTLQKQIDRAIRDANAP